MKLGNKSNGSITLYWEVHVPFKFIIIHPTADQIHHLNMWREAQLLPNIKIFVIALGQIFQPSILQ